MRTCKRSQRRRRSLLTVLSTSRSSAIRSVTSTSTSAMASRPASPTRSTFCGATCSKLLNTPTTAARRPGSKTPRRRHRPARRGAVQRRILAGMRPRPRRARVPAATVLLVASAGILPVGAQGGPNSLYQGPSPRPGPDVLYWPLATAPQLTNAGIWHAPPILVSGTTAYRQGEFLYQDWMYDDRGAAGGFSCCRDSGHIRNGSDLPAGNGGEDPIRPGGGTS